MSISVVIPCYKVDEYLDEAIRSVSIQTQPVKELIVIDDGSPIPLTRRTTLSSSSELIWIRTANQGLGAARNEGIHRASGEFVAFLDADDIWLETKIEKQVHFLRSKPQVAACYTRCVTENGFLGFGPYPNRELTQSELAVQLWYGQFFPPSTVMVRTDIAKKVGGFRTGLENGEDLDFWFRILSVGLIDGVQEELCKYRVHKKQITANIIRKIKGSKESRRQIIERFEPLLQGGGLNKRTYWNAYKREVLNIYFRRDFANANPLIWDFLRDHPRDSEMLKYAIISMLPPRLLIWFRDRFNKTQSKN